MCADNILDLAILQKIDESASELEKIFDADVISYNGPIHPIILKDFRNFIEDISNLPSKRETIAIFLNTGGGIVQTVEKMVEIIRHHYKKVYFVVPDSAMSAGTIFCMSGDKIYMDYSSSLGPIDPQVLITNSAGEEQYVPALGYLDQVGILVEKSRDGTLTPAEFAILQNQDLALLRSYEQARDLSIELLKKWLFDYKFQGWEKHRTDPKKKGKKVTKKEKVKRAEDIAILLGDNKTWHSHGRMIGIETLTNVLRLEIDDYSNDQTCQANVRLYNDLLTDYIRRQRISFHLHHRQVR